MFPSNVQNVQLPYIEFLTDELLDDEDNKVSEAFEVIRNAFKQAQQRTRTIKKAYKDLESITSNLLKKFENKETSAKNEARKPLVEKNLTCFNSSSLPKSHHCRKKDLTTERDLDYNLGNLFDENYLSKKQTFDQIEKRNKKNKFLNSTRQDQRSTSTPNEEIKFGLAKKKVDAVTLKKEDSIIVIPTASQIDETSPSLFDDEDDDILMYSQDFVNTCTEYTAVDDSSLRTDKEQNLGKIRKKHPVPSNLKTSQRVPFKDSIDATFFTPTEIDVLRYDLKDKPPRNGCSKVTDPRGNSDRVRPFRRTSNKNSENLSVNFRNLIRNISASNSSPQKIKNSSQYARKGVKRNVAKKNKLRGWDCAQCEKYYANLDLSDIEIQKRKDKCSRHRSNFNPRYSTPPGFWNPEFPDSPNFCDSSDN